MRENVAVQRALTSFPLTMSSATLLATQRSLFNIPADVTYLNCANLGPQMRSVTTAGTDAVRRKENPWKLTSPVWFSVAEELRDLAAAVMGATSDGVALVPAASYGIAIAAANVRLQRGQAVVLLHQEFPSNVYAWLNLAERNDGRIVTVQREPGENWTEALLRNIDETTAVVAAPQCHWTDGSRVDLVQIARRTREVGAALVIDASQSLGACSLDLKAVQPDFLVTVGYKWLLGPYSLGYLYAAPRWRKLGTPIEHSWMTRLGAEDFTRLVDYTEDYRPGARRFDMGEFSQFVLAPMAIAALRQIAQWTVPAIEQTLFALTERIAKEALKIGFIVLPREQRSPHMIGVRRPGGIPPELPKALGAAKIYVSLRGDSIRISPHLYNSEEDSERLFEVLQRFSA